MLETSGLVATGARGQKTPNPTTRRMSPKMVAMPQQISPTTLFPLLYPSLTVPAAIADTMAPIPAKGMRSQFSGP